MKKKESFWELLQRLDQQAGDHVDGLLRPRRNDDLLRRAADAARSSEILGQRRP